MGFGRKLPEGVPAEAMAAFAETSPLYAKFALDEAESGGRERCIRALKLTAKQADTLKRVKREVGCHSIADAVRYLIWRESRQHEAVDASIAHAMHLALYQGEWDPVRAMIARGELSEKDVGVLSAMYLESERNQDLEQALAENARLREQLGSRDDGDRDEVGPVEAGDGAPGPENKADPASAHPPEHGGA